MILSVRAADAAMGVVVHARVASLNKGLDVDFARVAAYDHVYHGNKFLAITNFVYTQLYLKLQLPAPDARTLNAHRMTTAQFLSTTVRPSDIVVQRDAVEVLASAMADALVRACSWDHLSAKPIPHIRSCSHPYTVAHTVVRLSMRGESLFKKVLVRFTGGERCHECIEEKQPAHTDRAALKRSSCM